jgi:hypothetical protein
MAATVLRFVRPSAVVMSVPEAAFHTYFECPPVADAVARISRLTGVSISTLRRGWGGPSGLRAAGIRYALSMAMG